MEYKKPRQSGTQPETKLVQKIVKELKDRGWYVKKLHGNKFQSGLPDLLCIHPIYGTLFVEVKTPNRKNQVHGGLSPRQVSEFNRMKSHGAKVYVLNSETQVDLLKTHPNYSYYLHGGSRKELPKV